MLPSSCRVVAQARNRLDLLDALADPALISWAPARCSGPGAHLAGDDREPLPCYASRAARRRREGHDVGLEGDAVDHADDVVDLLRRAGSDHRGHPWPTTAPPSRPTPRHCRRGSPGARCRRVLHARSAAHRPALLQVAACLLGALGEVCVPIAICDIRCDESDCCVPADDRVPASRHALSAASSWRSRRAAHLNARGQSPPDTLQPLHRFALGRTIERVIASAQTPPMSSRQR